MNCQRTREALPELLDPRTAPQALAEARAHLAGCPGCQREFALLGQTADALDSLSASAPSPRLRQNFQSMLEEEKRLASIAEVTTTRTHRTIRTSPWRRVLFPLAGCALVALGFMLGRRPAPVPALATPVAGQETQRELAAMHHKLDQQQAQLNRMTQLVGYSILQRREHPANERLREVLAASRQDQPTDKMLDDLIFALTLDPSANVRLRAIEALFPHVERELVRAGVLAALPREQNPLVQLELIDFVATAQVRGATPVLEQIAANETSDTEVRSAARRALDRL